MLKPSNGFLDSYVIFILNLIYDQLSASHALRAEMELLKLIMNVIACVNFAVHSLFKSTPRPVQIIPTNFVLEAHVLIWCLCNWRKHSHF